MSELLAVVAAAAAVSGVGVAEGMFQVGVEPSPSPVLVDLPWVHARRLRQEGKDKNGGNGRCFHS